jgi:methylthioribose-1-phosphate isomerase
VPFYVAAPTATVDLATASGDDIVIEERDAGEVTHVGRAAVAPPGVAARNPAFDVTPARLVTAIVTEVGIARPPYRRSLPSHMRRALVAEAGVPPHS